MLTPFDWQEGIGRRAQYVESRLSHGIPVVALSCEDGILIASQRRQSQKIFEIYDRLALASIGQQSDIEAIRVAAVDFAHQEGFNRSEEEVTIQRIVMGLSSSVKRSFSDFNSSPITAISLFAEVGEEIKDDRFVILNYDGDYETKLGSAAIAPTIEKVSSLEESLAKFGKTTADKAKKSLADLFDSPPIGSDELVPEFVLLTRSDRRENRFSSF